MGKRRTFAAVAGQAGIPNSVVPAVKVDPSFSLVQPFQYWWAQADSEPINDMP